MRPQRRQPVSGDASSGARHSPPLPVVGNATAQTARSGDCRDRPPVRYPLHTQTASVSDQRASRDSEAGSGCRSRIDVVEQELAATAPAADDRCGVTDPTPTARTLYVLAFAYPASATNSRRGAERIYLAQLAHLLGLDPSNRCSSSKTECLEQIDAEPGQ